MSTEKYRDLEFCQVYMDLASDCLIISCFQRSIILTVKIELKQNRVRKVALKNVLIDIERKKLKKSVEGII